MKWWDHDAMILVFWMLSFKATFSCSSFIFIRRLFSSSSLSAIRVVSSAYLRLLVFLPTILRLACASSSPAFHMMYSAYKLNNQGDNTQPWCSPFPIWNQSIIRCLVLNVASWPAYRFLKHHLPGASMGDPTHDKVMRRGLMGKASQASGVPPGCSWPSTLKPKSVYSLLYHTFLTLPPFLWKELIQSSS